MILSEPKLNTFVTPVLRDDLVERYLETLYANTPPNFYVYLIDQTLKGLDPKLRDRYPDLLIVRTPRTEVHKSGNLGFAKGTNTGIKLVETPYFTMCNDDVEFIDKRWWQGVMDAFAQVEQQTPDRPAMIVNPSTTKLPDWSIGRPSGEDHYIIPYKTKYTSEDWDHLVNDAHYVNEHLTLQPDSVIDGITLYCSVADTRRFLDVGLLDERYYPGGAEDYDLCCRASMKGYRSVGTTKSWVFHHWSSTLNSEELKKTVDDHLRFGDHNAVWGPRFDIWGIKCTKCDLRMRTEDGITASCPEHKDEIFKIPESDITPL